MDGRCSERATQCLAPEQRCAPDVDTRCSADSERIETCTRADPCGRWEVVKAADDCAAARLACGRPGSAAACVCAMPEAEILVDRAAPAGALAPSGASEPAECRFKTLGGALDYARTTWQPARAGAPVAVRAVGTPAPDAPVVFEGESLPLVVAPGVTLVAGGPAAADWVIAAAPSSTESVVQLHGGGALEGFTIRSGTPAGGHGITVDCGSAAPAVVSRVVVDGGDALSSGIRVGAGTCGAALADVDVSRVDGAALRVGADAGAQVTVASGRFHHSDVGVRVTGGNVTLGTADPAKTLSVYANEREGILIGGTTATIDARIERVAVSGNGGTGIVLDGVSASSKLALSACDVFSNGASFGRTYGPGLTPPVAGGALIHQDAHGPFEFRGNRFFGNAGVELAFETNATWSIAPSTASCGPNSNAFACLDGALAVAAAGGGSVDVSASVWPGTSLQSYMSASVTSGYYCNGEQGTPPLPETCPAP